MSEAVKLNQKVSLPNQRELARELIEVRNRCEKLERINYKLEKKNIALQRERINAFIQVETTREWYRSQHVAFLKAANALKKQTFAYTDKVFEREFGQQNDLKDELVRLLEATSKKCEFMLENDISFSREERTEASLGSN